MSKTRQTAKGKLSVRLVVLAGLLVIMAVAGWTAFALNQGTPPAPVATSNATLPKSAPPAPTTAASGPVSSPAPTAMPAVGYGVVTSRNLNLRAQPSTDAAVMSALKAGDIVALARRSGGWYQTTTGGWISAIYLEVRQTRDEAESYAHEIKPS